MRCVGNQQQPPGRLGYVKAPTERADEIDLGSGLERGCWVIGGDEHPERVGIYTGGKQRCAQIAIVAKIGNLGKPFLVYSVTTLLPPGLCHRLGVVSNPVLFAAPPRRRYN